MEQEVAPLGQAKLSALIVPEISSAAPCGSEAFRSIDNDPLHQPPLPGSEQFKLAEIEGGRLSGGGAQTTQAPALQQPV